MYETVCVSEREFARRIACVYMRRRRGMRRVVAPLLLVSIDQPEEIERSFIELMVQGSIPEEPGTSDR